jgi:hypothetical protein
MKTKVARISVALGLVVCLILTFTVPASAAGTCPSSVTVTKIYNNEEILNENLMGMQVIVSGSGKITAHVEKTATGENSWFMVWKFNGTVNLGPYTANYDIHDAFVTYNSGPNHFALTVTSASPFEVPEPIASFWKVSGKTLHSIAIVDGLAIYAR